MIDMLSRQLLDMRKQKSLILDRIETTYYNRELLWKVKLLNFSYNIITVPKKYCHRYNRVARYLLHRHRHRYQQYVSAAIHK